MYPERLLSTMVAQSKADIRLTRLTTQLEQRKHSYGDSQPCLSGCVAIKSILQTDDCVQIAWGFENIPVGPFTGREPRQVILQNIQGLVSHAGFLLQDTCLDVLCLVECSSQNQFM